MYLASGIDLLPGALGDPDFAALVAGTFNFETDARGLARGRVDQRDVRDVDRRFDALDPALRVGLGRLGVAHGDVDAGDDDAVLGRKRLQHFADRALGLAREHDD